MKITILIGALCALLPASALAAGDVGYVNVSKAIRDTAEGKMAFAEIDATARQHQVEVDSADASVTAAAAKCAQLAPVGRKTCETAAQAKKADAEQLFKAFNKDLIQRQRAVTERLTARATRILPKLAAAHKLTLIQPSDGALYVSPKADLTAELVKRYDAGEGKTDEDLAAELREKNAALERDKAAETKRAAELEAKVAALEKAAAKPAPRKN